MYYTLSLIQGLQELLLGWFGDLRHGLLITNVIVIVVTIVLYWLLYFIIFGSSTGSRTGF